MIAASPPPSPAWPPPPIGPWGPNSSLCAFVSDITAVVLVLVCFSFVALCLHAAARFLLRCLHDRRRRTARQAAAQAQEPEPKPPSDAVSGGGSSSASPVLAAVWAEAECAICLAELELDPEEGGERVRVLPACGHGFHAACVEAWLATRASCPTCRAPSQSRSRPPSRTKRAPQPSRRHASA